jgi:hypothetical protein
VPRTSRCSTPKASRTGLATWRESIYLRIAVGMPGTAHPAVPGLAQEQLTDLVEYVLSLARQPYRVLTNYDRRVRADARVYRERLGP